MKKLLSSLLAAILLLTCLPAMAEERLSETELLKDFGLTLELTSLRDACANDFALDSYGVSSRDPYSALGFAEYFLLPTDMVYRIFDDYNALPPRGEGDLAAVHPATGSLHRLLPHHGRAGHGNRV